MIHGRKFGQALIDAGIISADEHIRRVVIDVPCDDAVKIYVERYGDEKLLDVVLGLDGAEIRYGAEIVR